MQQKNKDGNIWIGTSAGPLLLDPNQITASAPTFTQVKVPRNDGTNYADYLLSGIDVSCIAVDGANCKWFGTKKWHISYQVRIIYQKYIISPHLIVLSNGIESPSPSMKKRAKYLLEQTKVYAHICLTQYPNESMTSDNVCGLILILQNRTTQDL